MITFLVRLFPSTVKHTRGKKKTAKGENVNLEYCDTGTGLHHPVVLYHCNDASIKQNQYSFPFASDSCHNSLWLYLGVFLGGKNHKIFRNKFYSIWSSDVIQVDHKTVFFFFFKM